MQKPALASSHLMPISQQLSWSAQADLPRLCSVCGMKKEVVGGLPAQTMTQFGVCDRQCLQNLNCSQLHRFNDIQHIAWRLNQAAGACADHDNLGSSKILTKATTAPHEPTLRAFACEPFLSRPLQSNRSHAVTLDPHTRSHYVLFRIRSPAARNLTIE